MIRRNGWSIYSREELAAGKPPFVIGDDSPPEGWSMDWVEVVDSTEFGAEHALQMFLLSDEWRGHAAYSVACYNSTTGSLAIWETHPSTVIIREKVRS